MLESARTTLRLRARLRRYQRLRHSAEFAALRREGLRVVRGCLILNARKLSAGGSARLGVVTGRGLGSAVVRSRARRLLREVFRLHQHDLAEPAALVLVARPSIVGKARPAVERDFLDALRASRLLRQAL